MNPCWRNGLLHLGLVAVLVCSGCTVVAGRSRVHVANRDLVLARLEAYMAVSRAVDADAIAGFYAPKGTLFEPGIDPVVSPSAIRAFIRSFPGVTVEVATATPDVVEDFGDTVFIWGSYHERLAFPGQPLSDQDGKFVMEWKRDATGEWLIERLFRVPLPPK